MFELKPCPFCGGNVVYISIHSTQLGAIECPKCGVRVLLPFCETVEELYEMWNKRVEK